MILKGTVANDSKAWQGHPDVAYFNGTLFVTYRQSDHHMARNYTQICVVTPHGKGYPFPKPQVVAKSKERLNCPRLSVIGDTLWLICDEVSISAKDDFFRMENKTSATKILLWKTMDGKTWEGPYRTNITGIVPDRICQTDDGYLIATHTKKYFDEAESMGNLVQSVWHSTDLEGEWTQYPLCSQQGLNMCEASICRLPDKTYIALLRENSGLGLPAFACYSEDGLHWSDPDKTRIFGCHRPVTGVLKSGNLLTTYREASCSFLPGFWAKNTFACLTFLPLQLGVTNDGFLRSIILPLDHDNSTKSDSGYTGWVQLPDESIYIVNYTNRDSDRPYIVWYHITEEEF